MNTPPASGWLIIDKPKGMTSAHVVARVKRLLSSTRRGERDKKWKIGHAGTLDPLATGLLVLALGEATKLIEYAQEGRKTYAFTVTFGEQRDTDDAEGQVVNTSEKRPTMAEIEAAIPQFLGKIQQVPPVYSAIKMDGKRAYAMARAGEQVEMKPREVEVHQLAVVSYQLAENDSVLPTANCQLLTLNVTCSKGTYVRSLGRDLAAATGCLGYISALRRLDSGCFLENMMISLEKLEEMLYKGEPFGVHAVDAVLDDIPAIELSPDALIRIAHGNPMPAPTHCSAKKVRVKQGERLVALCDVDQGLLIPVRVFNL